MKNIIPIAVVCMTLFSVCFSGCRSANELQKQPVATRAEELIGVWVGLTEDDAHYFRVRLSADGGGMCGYANSHDSAHLLTIRSWELKGGRTIRISLRPVGPDPEMINEITGRAYGNVMYVTVVGGRWRREMHLKRENEMERLLRSVKQRMAE